MTPFLLSRTRIARKIKALFFFKKIYFCIHQKMPGKRSVEKTGTPAQFS